MDNVRAWPNLAVTLDDSIIAAIYNQPNHLSGPGGNVECWGSVRGAIVDET